MRGKKWWIILTFIIIWIRISPLIRSLELLSHILVFNPFLNTRNIRCLDSSLHSLFARDEHLWGQRTSIFPALDFLPLLSNQKWGMNSHRIELLIQRIWWRWWLLQLWQVMDEWMGTKNGRQEMFFYLICQFQSLIIYSFNISQFYDSLIHSSSSTNLIWSSSTKQVNSVPFIYPFDEWIHLFREKRLNTTSNHQPNCQSLSFLHFTFFTLSDSHTSSLLFLILYLIESLLLLLHLYSFFHSISLQPSFELLHHFFLAFSSGRGKIWLKETKKEDEKMGETIKSWIVICSRLFINKWAVNSQFSWLFFWLTG